MPINSRCQALEGKAHTCGLEVQSADYMWFIFSRFKSRPWFPAQCIPREWFSHWLSASPNKDRAQWRNINVHRTLLKYQRKAKWHQSDLTLSKTRFGLMIQNIKHLTISSHIISRLLQASCNRIISSVKL